MFTFNKLLRKWTFFIKSKKTHILYRFWNLKKNRKIDLISFRPEFKSISYLWVMFKANILFRARNIKRRVRRWFLNKLYYPLIFFLKILEYKLAVLAIILNCDEISSVCLLVEKMINVAISFWLALAWLQPRYKIFILYIIFLSVFYLTLLCYILLLIYIHSFVK